MPAVSVQTGPRQSGDYAGPIQAAANIEEDANEDMGPRLRAGA
jgi:hypothetical protein